MLKAIAAAAIKAAPTAGKLHLLMVSVLIFSLSQRSL
jgi:hypothetical protein